MYLTSSQDASLVSKLFGCLRERYATRPGGFTRVLRIPNRKGDNAPMAIVELVDNRQESTQHVLLLTCTKTFPLHDHWLRLDGFEE